jgi:hypothetical protein
MDFIDHPHAADVARLRRLAQRMDSAIRLPIIGVRVGWDSILGLIPGVGDAAALLPAGYIVKEAHRMGASRSVLTRMAGNIGIDLVIGTIPLLGDLFDIGWKANLRNVDLLHRHLAERAENMATTAEVEGRLSSHHPNLRG